MASREATDFWLVPFTVEKLPATITRSWAVVRPMPRTVASVVGAQPSREPSDADTAASELRATLFTDVKKPPRYTTLLVAVIANTSEPATGAKFETSEPSEVLNAAIRYRPWPLTAVNDPPM